MKTKKFKLDLNKYEVETPQGNTEYPLRENFSSWLRTAGMFKTAEDVAEAVSIARQIRSSDDEFLMLDEKEAAILRQALDKLIALTADGKAALGGEIHEEAICRVVNMEVIEE